MPTSSVDSKAYAAGALSATSVTFCGYSLRETAGSAAVVRVWDNASAASGTLLATIGLAASASETKYFGEEGIRAENGVFLQTVSGAVEGCVYVA